MDNDEQQRDNDLRNALQQTAPAPPPSADEFESILRRAQRGRARVLGIALVIALIAGPLAGVLLGFGLDDGGDPVTVASGNPGAERSTLQEDSDAVAGPVTVVGGQAWASGSAGAFPGAPNLTPLFVRTTSDGVTMRVYRADLPQPDQAQVEFKCAPDASCPEPAPMPQHCMPSTTLQAELSNEGAVDPGFVSVSELAPDSLFEVVQASFFGVPEKSPAAWVAVRASDSITAVRVRFSDGAVDEMAPVQGFAVLAHQMAAPPQPASFEDPEAFRKSTLPGGTVEVLDSSGTVVGSGDLSETYGMGKECMVPPLPAPTPMPPMPGGAEPMPMPMPVPPLPDAAPTVASDPAAPVQSPATPVTTRP